MERDAQLWKKIVGDQGARENENNNVALCSRLSSKRNQLQVRHVSASADCFFCGKHEMMCCYTVAMLERYGISYLLNIL
jgi:hypothetical protein